MQVILKADRESRTNYKKDAYSQVQRKKHEACVQYMELVINTMFNIVIMSIKYLPSGCKIQQSPVFTKVKYARSRILYQLWKS